MRVYHDWEFLEDGERIHPIAVAMCTDDGRPGLTTCPITAKLTGSGVPGKL